MTELMQSLSSWQWLGILLARLVVGVLFVITGAGKLLVPAKRDQMRETIRSAGVPAPELSAPFLSWVELLGGLALVFGLLTPLAALLLIGVMLGGLFTTVLPAVDADGPVEWLGEVLYLPEVLYLVLLIWLLLAGPGKVSLDSWLGPAPRDSALVGFWLYPPSGCLRFSLVGRISDRSVICSSAVDRALPVFRASGVEPPSPSNACTRT